jgi:hypothetical protein
MKWEFKQFFILMSCINNYIPFFPNATVLLKYSEEELLGILEFAVPPHLRKSFDLRDNHPTSEDKARFIEECERVEWNKEPLARERDNSDDDRRSNKKTKFAKSDKSATKSGQKKDMECGPKYCTHCKSATKSGQKKDKESGPKYCSHCKTDTHNTEPCWKLKKIEGEKN